MQKNTIILFDLDGTLIDSTEAILESFGVVFGVFGKSVPDDNAIKQLIGQPLDVMFARLGIEDDRINSYVQAYKAHYRTIHTAKTTLLPGALEAVKRAESFAYLGVVTTKTSRSSRELLEYFGIMKYFRVLMGREEVTRPKPDPEPVQKALEALPEVAGGRYMVGDTCLDMTAATAANIHGVGVLCGYGDAKKLQKCSNTIAKSAFEAVNAILNKIKTDI